jgi:AraC family transcriptional regulator of adaptative response/methylated-DNA-[protein]-cysteine methyltransferase
VIEEDRRKEAGTMSTKTEALAAAVVSDPRWAAVVARDAGADGSYFYSVKTTGVYCRPSCAARAARPENVDFHPTAAAAEQAGFRACKRCKPGQPSLAEQQAGQVAELCRFIQSAEQAPSLEELASRAGLSVYHLHRVFKAITGVTPKAYAAAHRAERVRAGLARSGTVTEAIYDAGYNSNGRFYEESNQVLGMTPTSYRAGGANTEIRFAVGECSLGSILVAVSARGVCAILLGDDPSKLARDLQDRFPRATLLGGEAEFESLVAKVVGFVEAPRVGLDLPLESIARPRGKRMKAVREIAATGAAKEITERVKSVDWGRVAEDLDARGCSTIVLLSEPERDFTGGEFVITEQRPRMQSRPEVVPLRQGDAVVFAVHHRPVQGTRGMYRVNLRHGVSRVRSGHRHTVGVIFHDAS